MTRSPQLVKGTKAFASLLGTGIVMPYVFDGVKGYLPVPIVATSYILQSWPVLYAVGVSAYLVKLWIELDRQSGLIEEQEQQIERLTRELSESIPSCRAIDKAFLCDLARTAHRFPLSDWPRHSLEAAKRYLQSERVPAYRFTVFEPIPNAHGGVTLVTTAHLGIDQIEIEKKRFEVPNDEKSNLRGRGQAVKTYLTGKPVFNPLVRDEDGKKLPVDDSYKLIDDYEPPYNAVATLPLQDPATRKVWGVLAIYFEDVKALNDPKARTILEVVAAAYALANLIQQRVSNQLSLDLEGYGEPAIPPA